MGAMPSPITGSAGNIEFLLHARTPGDGPPDGRADSDAAPSSPTGLRRRGRVAEAHRPARGG